MLAEEAGGRGSHRWFILGPPPAGAAYAPVRITACRLRASDAFALIPLLLLLRHEFQREGVDAMPSVSRGKEFSSEYVAQMAAAVGALDLRSLTVGVR